MRTDTLSFSYRNLTKRHHTVGQNIHHLEWCPKYRYKMFRQRKYKNLLQSILEQIADRHRIKLMEVAIAPDHIHIIADLPFNMSPSRARQLMKGGSAYQLFRTNPNFRKRYPKGHFWAPSAYSGSVGNPDLETVVNYVRNHAQTTLALFSQHQEAPSFRAGRMSLKKLDAENYYSRQEVEEHSLKARYIRNRIDELERSLQTGDNKAYDE